MEYSEWRAVPQKRFAMFLISDTSFQICVSGNSSTENNEAMLDNIISNNVLTYFSRMLVRSQSLCLPVD